jgi:signal transduction histidine kinase
MMNNDGTMGDVEARLDITIRPPFYSSWWAILLYIILAGCAGYLWYQRILRRHAERVELERQLRDYERQQIMSTMRAEMAVKQSEAQPAAKQKMPFLPVTNEIVGFVKRYVESFKAADNKPFRLSFQSSLNRLTMQYDPDLVKRMLDILMTNAVKFAPAGSRVKVNMAEVDRMCEIQIADRGLGIPEESRANLFDPNVESVVEFDVVARIVNLHGGTVHAEDNPDGGTIVIVRLPIEMKVNDDIPVEDAVLMDD